MTRTHDRIAYGHVLILICDDNSGTMHFSLHRRDRRRGTWTDGLFDQDDLPFLLMAIQRVYAKHRRRADRTVFDTLALATRPRTGMSDANASWNGQPERTTLDGSNEDISRRIP